MNKLDFDNLRKLSKEQLVDYIVDNIGINDFPTPNENVEWTVYGRDTCPFCIKTHELLETVGNFVYVNIEDISREVFEELIPKKTGNYQYIPIIFNRNKFIGGYENLVKLIENRASTKIKKFTVKKVGKLSPEKSDTSPKKVNMVRKKVNISPKKVNMVRKKVNISPKKVAPKKVSPKKISPKKVSPKKVSPNKVSKFTTKKVNKF